ncbi:NAD(P)/FAD-dependent oxidoreductase [Kitasatospora sp. NPDC059673]|uniref:NAD(P)/FAD-dependent oxidoreductase n=1 Tax=Kitasatospora sp. NPDC059673 TaxID=3346901 RepID=UPI00368444DE
MNLARRSTETRTGHALVLGAGISGLCAARALSEVFDRVTLVERDTLAGDGAVRRGVPQGAHVHSLTVRGANVLEEFFPGFVGELAADGATLATALSEVEIVFFGSLLRKVPLGTVLQTSRPFLEDRLRAKVCAAPNVTLLDGREATAPLTTSDRTRVTGVRTARPGAPGSTEDIDADLVVDAMGRAGRGATWLATLGYEKPAEQRLRVDVAYASRRYRLPPGAMGPDKALLVGATPARPRGLVLTSQENGIWVLSLYGFGRAHHPPTAPDQFLLFAQELASADAREALRRAEPVTDVASFAHPHAVRRHFHRLRRLPDGLISIGDAICSLNPIYGAGMTVAALEAAALRECLLADGTRNLPRRFYRSAAKALHLSWLFSTLADKSMPQVPGTRPALSALLAQSFRATMRAAATDPKVAAAVWNAVSLTGSPAELARPHIITAMLRNWPREPAES